MGCHRMGRESRSPVHVTCQQRSSSQIATTGSLWPAMRTRTGVFIGAVQIGLHPGSPEAGPCELVRGKANTPALVHAAWMIGPAGETHSNRRVSHSWDNVHLPSGGGRHLRYG